MSSNSSSFQVDKIFRSGKYSQSQIDKLVQILEVVGKYMLIDRDILNARSYEKIGLSHIQRAIKENLIVEFKDAAAFDSLNEVEDHHYFYTLGVAGINFLRLAGKKFYCFNIAEPFDSKEKMLIFNHHCLNAGINFIFSEHNDMGEFNFFHCKDTNNLDIICYHGLYITEKHVISILKRRFVSKLSEEDYEDRHELFREFISKFRFESIEFVVTTYTDKLKVQYTSNNVLSDEQRFDSETDTNTFELQDEN